MLRIPSYFLVLVLLALGVVIVLMAIGVVPAPRTSLLGALIAGDSGVDSSQPAPVVTPIQAPISFDGLRPGQTEAFGLREGLVVVNAIYDGAVEPFSASLRSLDDPQVPDIAPVSIVPPLDRQGAAAAQIRKAGRYVLNVERAEGEWAVTIEQPS